jgi:hypothetical protein
MLTCTAKHMSKAIKEILASIYLILIDTRSV